MLSFVPLFAVLLAQTAATPAPVTWAGTVSLGFISLTGNSQTVTFSTTAAFERKSPDWIWGIKGAAAYGESTPPTGGDSQVTALMGSVQARGDRRFSDMLSLYLLLGVDADHLKSIEARPAAELGLSEIWFDVKEGDFQKTTLKTDVGLRAVREYRFQYYPWPDPKTPNRNLPDVDSLAPRVGAAYRYAFNKEVIFTEEASALLSAVGDDSGRAILTSVTKLSSRLTERIGLGVGFAITHDTEPPPKKVKTDTALTVGLEIGI